MQYPNRKINFAQRIIKAKPKFWMKSWIKIFRLDFREVVSIYCVVDSVFYHKMSNTIYGIYIHNNVKISITKLFKSFIDANKMKDKISPNVRFTLHNGSQK